MINKETLDNVKKSRQKIYGSSLENHIEIAYQIMPFLKKHWKIIRDGVPLPAWVIAAIMVAIKFNRMRISYSYDNYVDLRNYLEFMEEWQKSWTENSPTKDIERIYVSGPLSNGDTKKNIEIASDIGLEIIKKGHLAFVPHFNYPWDGKIDYEEFMRQDLDFIENWATALYRIAASPGADRELKLAQDLNLTIYNNLDEIPKL